MGAVVQLLVGKTSMVLDLGAAKEAKEAMFYAKSCKKKDMERFL